ncbi:MAG TPA: hypothetical protein PL033_00210 [Candidatus Brocadiia bacterium]|nr:hypothetical protein [Candidatus Brocadiia bacterium]
MIKMPLTDGWLLASSREVLRDRPHEVSYRPKNWLPVRAPMTVQSALVESGKIPSPWLDRNTEIFQVFEKDTWWYRLEFEVPASARNSRKFELLLEGISVHATVWFNDAPVGFARNAHYPHSFDVTPFIKSSGNNVIALECSLGLEWLRRNMRNDVTRGPDEIKPYARAAQMMFGWDFAPRLPIIGVWRPVSLIYHGEASISDLHVRTLSVNGGTAELEIVAETQAFSSDASPLTLALEITEGPNGPVIWKKDVPVVPGTPCRIPLCLDKARPWYPQHAGEQFLYTIKTRLLCGKSEVDSRIERFGVRTVELLQDGEFVFAINGRKVFAQGANWVPADSLSLDATPERYRHLLELARDAGFTMLRVWGGGIYEPEIFYDLCDEFGIMVWQDFMYACSMYPDDDPGFMESAQSETRSVVQRLRRHPSVVLWCGNNECNEAWELGDWHQRTPRHMGERLYDHVLPETVKALAPGTPYWPGSPYGGPTTRSRSIGDFHDWYSLPNWRTYDINAPLFSSEYGFRSVPARETVEEMISPKYQWEPNGPPQHAVWQFHHGRCEWLWGIMPEFGTPRTLDDFIMLSQETQATLMRYAVELYRRRMFKTAGSLLWQYNEPWAAVTFSIVDYYGRPKASYFWVKRACAPILGMIYSKDGVVSYWGINDLSEELSFKAVINRYSYDGKILGEETAQGILRPNCSAPIMTELPSQLAITDEKNEFLRAKLTAGNLESERFYHAGHRKDWRLQDVSLKTKAIRKADGSVEVSIECDGFAHFVSALVADPLARYSDNFIDILPGETRRIVIRAQGKSAITIRAANYQARTIEPA